jgi:hypothetical protein
MSRSGRGSISNSGSKLGHGHSLRRFGCGLGAFRAARASSRVVQKEKPSRNDSSRPGTPGTLRASKPRRLIIGDGQTLAHRAYESLNLNGAAARLRHYRDPAVSAQIAC